MVSIFASRTAQLNAMEGRAPDGYYKTLCAIGLPGAPPQVHQPKGAPAKTSQTQQPAKKAGKKAAPAPAAGKKGKATKQQGQPVASLPPPPPPPHASFTSLPPPPSPQKTAGARARAALRPGAFAQQAAMECGDPGCYDPSCGPPPPPPPTAGARARASVRPGAFAQEAADECGDPGCYDPECGPPPGSGLDVLDVDELLEQMPSLVNDCGLNAVGVMRKLDPNRTGRVDMETFRRFCMGQAMELEKRKGKKSDLLEAATTNDQKKKKKKKKKKKMRKKEPESKGTGTVTAGSTGVEGKGKGKGKGKGAVPLEPQAAQARTGGPTKSKAGGASEAGPERRATVCSSFQKSGECKFGDRCRYSHVQDQAKDPAAWLSKRIEDSSGELGLPELAADMAHRNRGRGGGPELVSALRAATGCVDVEEAIMQLVEANPERFAASGGDEPAGPARPTGKAKQQAAAATVAAAVAAAAAAAAAAASSTAGAGAECKFFLSKQGCRFGDRCRLRHGGTSLPSAPPAPSKAPKKQRGKTAQQQHRVDPAMDRCDPLRPLPRRGLSVSCLRLRACSREPAAGAAGPRAHVGAAAWSFCAQGVHLAGGADRGQRWRGHGRPRSAGLVCRNGEPK